MVQSSPVVEEVDYSAEAVITLANEIIAKYENEDPKVIKAVTIGANASYMTEEDIDNALNTVGLSMEQVDEKWLEYFEMKSDKIYEAGSKNNGSLEDTGVLYTELSRIDEYALNPSEYEAAKFLEDTAVTDVKKVK